MRPLFYSLFFLFLSTNLSVSQSLEGVISYKEEKVNPSAEKLKETLKAKGIKADIPAKQTSTKTLYFTSEQSLYKAAKDDENDYDGPNRGGRRGGGTIVIRNSNNDQSSVYRHLKDSSMVRQKSIFNKLFLITDKQEPIQWKVTGRSEQLGAYQVLEAVTIHEKDTIQAWFSPQIAVSTGPAEFSQLPGLILRVDVNQGERVIYATQIDLRPLNEEETIHPPSEGKQVTYDEFITIREKKIEEIKMLYGEDRNSELIELN